MSNTIIQVENLGKKYLIKHQQQERYTALRDVIANKVKSFGKKIISPWNHKQPFSHSTTEEFWALKDVSFEIKRGEVIGIIGRNGAGKTTLLKILSRITELTTGRFRIRGRVVSLLEVGTGFHPELTGRENIFLNGAILGMKRKEIKKKFDEIVAFAETEQFLDMPVKRYSSGMYVRLAFAVAAHLEPEILLVDEVLAVGDVQFQKKCLGKMGDVAKEGRTVIFVSHNMAAIKALCNRSILFDRGELIATGEVRPVLTQYMQLSVTNKLSHKFVKKRNLSSGAKAELLEISVTGAKGEPKVTVLIDQSFFIRIVWRLNVPVPFLRVGVDVIDSSGVTVLSSMDTDTTDLLYTPRQPGVFRESLEIPPYLLMPGTYEVNVFAGMPRVERIFEDNEVVGFEIVDNQTHLSHFTGLKRSGYIAKPLMWDVDIEYAE
jgi:lipopolysaccharide transport system ATP-binding protein